MELEPVSRETTAIELAYRETDGLQVQLLYRKVGNEVLLHVIDTMDEQDMEFLVPRDKALDAFEHPYVYAPQYFEAA